MRKFRKISFKDLVNENKRQLLSDHEEMERIEKKLEDKHSKNA
ncbi:FbpB family small basic protein [Fictibacillus sp. Mic-4]|nr:FbpB family small basic protein [Fictibacillus gelatini]